MKVALLVQPILSHYRQSLFELLVNDKRIDFRIISGNKLNSVKVFESKSHKIEASLKNYHFTIGGHIFYFQKGLIKALKKHQPTHVIFGGPDYHFISTILVSFYLILFTKIKVHYWTHGMSKSNSRLQFGLTKFLYSKASLIFTYEEKGKEGLISKMGIDENKIIVVKNCLNEWDYGFNKEIENTSADNTVLNILFSGRLTKEKSVVTLIEAIKKLVDQNIDIQCVIIGDGAMKMELENLAHELCLTEHIVFKGALYQEDVEKYFRSSDIFVLPGKVGLSIVHALSFGLPVITTSLPIHSPEAAILKQNENAFFFNGKSAEELSKTILTFYGQIKKRNINMKNACVKSVLDNGYTPNSMKEKITKGFDFIS